MMMLSRGRCGKRAKRFIVALLAFFLLFPATLALAIEYGGYGGRPAYPRPDNPRTDSIFVHTLELGEVKEEGVVVLNNTPATKTLLVYAADSTPSTGGAFACKQLLEPKEDVGAWIELERDEVTLRPMTNELVDFTITVPEDASVGEHNGCILVQEKKEDTNRPGVNLSIRTGLRVAITIPGEIKRKLEIVGFSVTRKPDGFLLVPKVRNDGNVSIDAQAVVVTRNLFGKQIFKHGGEFPILRGEVSDWNFELAKPFWGGWYRSQFVVEYDQGEAAGIGTSSGEEITRLESPTVWFFSFPTTAGLVIEILAALFLLFVIVAILLPLRRRSWIKNEWGPYRVRIGDDIYALAKQLDVSWKLLAKVNGLKAPYKLPAGKTIKIPPQRKGHDR